MRMALSGTAPFRALIMADCCGCLASASSSFCMPPEPGRTKSMPRRRVGSLPSSIKASAVAFSRRMSTIASCMPPPFVLDWACVALAAKR